MRHVQPVG